MSVLVTGATGFVGSAVARQLVSRGESVRVLVRAGGDRRNIADLPVEPVEGDLRDGDSLARAVRGCRALYHVAADYRIWVPRPDDIYETNVAGTTRLLHAAAAEGIERIVYTSSVAVLGARPGEGAADEETPVCLADMIGHYKRSKFLAEEAVRRLVDEEGLPVVIVNPSTPIGPRDVKPTPTGRLIVEAATGRMPAFVDTGLNVVHVDDVAAGHLLAFDRGVVGERYVLGGENLTLRDILAEIARLCGRRVPRVRLPHGLVMPIAYAAESVSRVTGREPFVTVDGLRMARKKMFFSSAKAETALGYRARPAEEALADAVEWFRGAGYLSKN
ncbi:MAG: hopanoid-associated sugar epimerase [Alphaproteobacteria bacterium]